MTNKPTPPAPESRWTPPRPDCPHPEYWTSTDAHSTEIEVSELVAAFVRALQPDYVVETGTCWGQTAELIGQALRANRHGRLISLEIDAEKIEYSRNRCGGLPVEVIQCSSLEFAPTETIGFAWFDSLLDLRLPEFLQYREHMQAGTVVGFHDTGPQFGAFGPMIASIPGIRPIQLPTPRGVTFAEVL
ncbi:class I SAM-dependent methyltransferase [Kribbella sp. NPDC051718]|uniref:class I SAM-dependent methyltransferase n=1 Tax=Kribbella sp. NPDC051718 TaxID=3155168 RepID=UPI003415C970